MLASQENSSPLSYYNYYYTYCYYYQVQLILFSWDYLPINIWQSRWQPLHH